MFIPYDLVFFNFDRLVCFPESWSRWRTWIFLKTHPQEQFIYNSSHNEIEATTGRMMATKGLLFLLFTTPCVFADKEESREVVVEVEGGLDQVA